MGTLLSLSRRGSPDRAAALAASETAVEEIARVEALLSTWRRGGPLDPSTRRRREPSRWVLEVASLLLESVFDWSERTDGAFDPTVLPLVRAWDLRGAGGPRRGASALAAALAATGRGRFRLDGAAGRALRLSADAGIDEGAWGKGYALDRAVSALRRCGVTEALLDLGGQVAAIGRTTVAVADPRDRGRPSVALAVEDESVSTSGQFRARPHRRRAPDRASARSAPGPAGAGFRVRHGRRADGSLGGRSFDGVLRSRPREGPRAFREAPARRVSQRGAFPRRPRRSPRGARLTGTVTSQLKGEGTMNPFRKDDPRGPSRRALLLLALLPPAAVAAALNHPAGRSSSASSVSKSSWSRRVPSSPRPGPLPPRMPRA